MSCPTSEDLLRAALGAEDAQLVERHVQECPLCAQELNALRETVQDLRAQWLAEGPARDVCLDDAQIAALVDGAHPVRDGLAIEHLASCGRCREKLAGVTRLVRDVSVAGEIAKLEPPARKQPGPRVARLTVAAGLAAAALAAVMFGPQVMLNWGDTDGAGILRERAITTTAAPEILGPLGLATQVDSLRWTSVPSADLYRVTVWDREGTVLWQGETRDTVLHIPSGLQGYGAAPLLWEVKARTGWGRWVASELGELTLRERRRNR